MSNKKPITILSMLAYFLFIKNSYVFAQAPIIDLNQLLAGGKGVYVANFGNLGEVVSRLIIYSLSLAGILLLAFLIKGGFDFLTSAGDPKKMESAKNAITMAVVGFIIIVAAFWITQIVNYVFGLGGVFQ